MLKLRNPIGRGRDLWKGPYTLLLTATRMWYFISENQALEEKVVVQYSTVQYSTVQYSTVQYLAQYQLVTLVSIPAPRGRHAGDKAGHDRSYQATSSL